MPVLGTALPASPVSMSLSKSLKTKNRMTARLGCEGVSLMTSADRTRSHEIEISMTFSGQRDELVRRS